MVNRKLGLGILVMALVFGMTVVGNLEAQTDSGGEFILTDIPKKYNGKYAFLTGGSSESQIVIQTTDELMSKKSFPIIDGKVILPLWVQIRGDGREIKLVRYSGNDTLVLFITIIEKEDVNSKVLETVTFGVRYDKYRINFSNGSATGSYKKRE